MGLIDSLGDYRRAIEVGASKSERGLLRSLASVLKARGQHDIGPRFHSLFELIERPEDQWPEYVNDERLRKALREVNPARDREIVNDKFAFFEHCTRRGLATIPILARIDTVQTDGLLNAPTAERLRALLDGGPPELFVKLIDGTWGIDAFIVRRLPDGRLRFGDVDGDAAALHAHCIERLGERRGWILQPLVRNHPDLARIMSGRALGTVRAVTCWSGDSVELLFAVIRLPVGDSAADNFAHGSSGNLTAAVDVASGRVGPARGSRNRRWPDIAVFERHPDSGVPIAGSTVPFWAETVALVRDAQRSLPRLKTLGWDVAVTADGPVLVEANATYDVDLVQVALGRGLRSQLLEHGLLQPGPAAR